MANKFGDRMKDYENAYRTKLPKRMPVILRLDGKSFHSYTKGFAKPFDEILNDAMSYTAIKLCENIMGAKIAYHQSDEISILITNYDKLTTESWFDNNIQKMTSVAASMATAYFNFYMHNVVEHSNGEDFTKLAMFDARVWVLPHDEVCNSFLWRQQDATKNSISMVAQVNFPHKSLQNLNGKQMQDKLMLEKEINWNDLPTWQKRGTCIVKEQYDKDGTMRSRWVPDLEIPIFSQDRNYIEKYVYLNK